MKQYIISSLGVLLTVFTNYSFSQCPQHDLIGYWHNWNIVECPYVPLDQINNRYSIIDIAFAVPTSPSDMHMTFVPEGVTTATFISQVQALKNQGKKVVISIGGATASIDLTTTANKNAFVSTMTNIIETYGFNGLDLDIEHGNSVLASGTIANPTDPACTNLIAAVQEIMTAYQTTHGTKLYLSMAPETAYVQGGVSAYGSIWGGYLPLIDGLRDELDILHIQYYNSGSMVGLDGNSYSQGTADFIIAMTESVIQGFNTSGGAFQGIPESKIAIGLPACELAAGGGYTSPAVVQSAVNYLMGNGPQPGSYSLIQSQGYPELRGLMTWSINWDALGSCNGEYEFADSYYSIFGDNAVLTVPEITWNNPSDIVAGTALSATQLNASTIVPGTFIYAPPSGTILEVGTHTITANFIPSDSCVYASTSATVEITVTENSTNSTVTLSDNKLSFYPNPSKGTLYLSYPVKAIQLYDISGKQVLFRRVSDLEISIENLSNGIYFIQLDGISSKLLIKD